MFLHSVYTCKQWKNKLNSEFGKTQQNSTLRILTVVNDTLVRDRQTKAVLTLVHSAEAVGVPPVVALLVDQVVLHLQGHIKFIAKSAKQPSYTSTVTTV